MAELNIYQKMLKATDKIQSVAKNLTVSTGKSSSYKAVGELDILNAVKPIEVELGIYSYPYSRQVIDTAILEKESDYGTKKSLYMRIETIYRFVNVDNPSEYVEVTSYGDGIDTGDKATGKAMTYSDKYALMKAYKISTGDDPDQEKSEEYTSYKSDGKITEKQISMLKKFYQGDNFQKLLDCNKLSRIEDMPKAKASEIINKLMEKQKNENH